MRLLLSVLGCLVCAGIDNERAHSYGRLMLEGAVEGLEFYRAYYGGLLPCAPIEIVIAPDELLCDALSEAASHFFSGRYVVARRGGCSFFNKTVRAAEGGAAGLLLINSDGGLFRISAGNATLGYTGPPLNFPVVLLRHSAKAYIDHVLRFKPSASAT